MRSLVGCVASALHGLQPRRCFDQRLVCALRPRVESGIIFLPLYAAIGYTIDVLSGGSRVMAIGGVSLQADQLKPIFKSDLKASKERYVPSIAIVIRQDWDRRHSPYGVPI